MRELEDAGLVEKKRQGFCMPNILYVKIPQEESETCLSGGKEKELSGETETCRSEEKKSAHQRVRNLSSNQMNNSQKIQSQISGERGTCSIYGKYQNVYLSEFEYRELDTGSGPADRGIIRLYEIYGQILCRPCRYPAKMGGAFRSCQRDSGLYMQ